MNEVVETKQSEQEAVERPAGFWIRFFAYMIDGLIFTPIAILAFVNLFIWKNLSFVILLAIPGFIYKPFMESIKGATLGKMVCGIRVINKDAGKISLLSSYIRYIPFFLAALAGILVAISMFGHPDFKNVTNFVEFQQFDRTIPRSVLQYVLYWVIFIDCLAIVFNKRKRAMHDMIAGSSCVRTRKDKTPKL